MELNEAQAGAASVSPDDQADRPDAEDRPDVGLAEEPSGNHLLALWSGREEVHALPELLRPDEALVSVGAGSVLRSGRLSHARWLVVLTDRRLLCIRGRAAATRKVIDMPISAVRSVARKGLVRATLTVDTGYGTLRLSGIKKSVARELEEGLAALMRTFEGDDAADATALPRADLPAADPADDAVRAGLAELEARVESLRTRVAALEEQARTVAGG